MVETQKALLLVVLAVLAYPNDIFGGAYQPEFAGPITNLTIPLGRDATFTCLVKHLGGYRVGWVKADTKAIQAIHDHVITHNKRISVSHSDHTMWNLNIKGVQVEDEGLYMCQINTDPMKSQTGMLSIVVPPDFVPEDTSSDVNVGENGQVKLTCRARGVPPPRVSWRREDGKGIIIREPAGSALNQKSHVTTLTEFHGEELKLTKISRTEMGVYLCIASNGVPPAVSKRISINVHFTPAIHVPNQLVGAPLGTDVVLECYVEASPMSINYWMKEKGTMIISSTQHVVDMIEKSTFEVRMILTIKNLQKHDVGTYHCAAKNSLGEVDSTIRLYEIPGPAKTELATWASFYDEDNNKIPYGQAEMDKTENNSVYMENSLLHGSNHARLPPTLATALPTSVKIGKNRPTVNISSYANDLTIRHNALLLLLLLLLSLSSFSSTMPW
ncbi:lachesin-like isoform X1 [Vespa crabro]|uniref:lachesin-like isoform X1 n=2 Tax=Vespa crabro TaxID=7445 RepID=UPI001F00B0C2|nr:lachesin-like isoform X1 [Vespa crabro]XP_046829336.1 lachesin-like isoform X1 [Vespa crabro]XP_046829337.1 lachesin-like isoform X1 [Vespa crabro]XP_046829338.1 lachesin-like isoform X1 [Vespa crabro]XP_046829339.1 lachesin-like isoform X1 [Vespa crabro]XP_046829340.1 lachesin-like isoform X1 [Vespa crabro]XP_046829342.1 lachesin-like isoform X1 [Vespa crabro]XP_046829343.1 lachesin-like isoform X1 [Vespa crabro]XP_046829344.1 lachesin-like isoform X1 [Vespa crabro]